MSDYKPSPTPIEPGIPNVIMPTDDAQGADTDAVYWYGLVVGSLIYAITMIRPDLGYILSVLSRYCANPDTTHIKAATRLLRYIKGTLLYRIYYKGTTGFVGYTDAD